MRESRVSTLVHRVITPEQVMTDRYNIVERTSCQKEHDDEGQTGDDLLMMLCDGGGEGRHDANLCYKVNPVHYIV